MSIIQDPDAGFTATIWGFKIAQGPPAITGIQDWPPSPTPLRPLQVSQAITYPPLDINFNSYPLELPDGVAVQGKPAVWNAARVAWEIGGLTTQVALEQLPYTLSLHVAANNNVGAPTNLSIVVNGQVLEANYSNSSFDWFDASWPLPPDLLKDDGPNEIDFWEGGDDHSLVLRQIRFARPETPQITALYQWVNVFQGYVQPGGEVQQSVSVQTGTTATDTETKEFSWGISASVTAKVDEGFVDSLSATLTTSFTSSSTQSHSIAISKQNTTTLSLSATAPNDKGLTFAYWQPRLVFQAGTLSIDQHFDSPIVMTSFAG